MSVDKALPFPLSLLFLDFVGALMFALGIMEFTAPGSMWPEAWRFPGLVWFCFIAGALLMLPMVLHMVNRAKAQAEKD